MQDRFLGWSKVYDASSKVFVSCVIFFELTTANSVSKAMTVRRRLLTRQIETLLITNPFRNFYSAASFEASYAAGCAGTPGALRLPHGLF